MTAPAPSPMAALVSRLTNPQDRETYAALLSYFDSLPPDDEMFRLARLLGLLALLAERIPEAAADVLQDLRALSEVANTHHVVLNERLAGLTSEIADGIDIEAIARAMAESVRQAAGQELQDVKALATETVSELRLLNRTAHGVGAKLADERGRLVQATLGIVDAAAKLEGIAKRQSTWLYGICVGVGFLAGVVAVLAVLAWRG